MNLDTMLFCRVLWMDKYQGIKNEPPQDLQGGFAKEHGFGHGCWNFRLCEEKMYGYVYLKCSKLKGDSDPGKVVKRLAKNAGLKNPKTHKKIKDVTVVWVAKNPQDKKTVVVGWWENATIFNDWRARPDAEKIAKEIKKFDKNKKTNPPRDVAYFITCEEKDATLIPAANRNVEILRAKKGKTGRMGTAHIWYADGGDTGKHKKAHRKLKEQVKAHILAYSSKKP